MAGAGLEGSAKFHACLSAWGGSRAGRRCSRRRTTAAPLGPAGEDHPRAPRDPAPISTAFRSGKFQLPLPPGVRRRAGDSTRRDLRSQRASGSEEDALGRMAREHQLCVYCGHREQDISRSRLARFGAAPHAPHALQRRLGEPSHRPREPVDVARGNARIASSPRQYLKRRAWLPARWPTGRPCRPPVLVTSRPARARRLRRPGVRPQRPPVRRQPTRSR